MTVPAYRYVEPESVEEAVAVLAEHGDEARPMAGGTGLTLLIGQGLMAPGVVVGLRPRGELARLASIERTAEGGLEIGALATIRRLEHDALVAGVAPGLARAAHRVASVRIRNQATLGGHVAHADPAQDLPPVLLALDAVVDIAGPAGRRSIAITDLAVDVFETSLAADELVVGIRIPAPSPSMRVVTKAFRPRTAEDYPTVAVAVRLDTGPDGRIAGARVALGAVAATAVRAAAAERALVGRSLTGRPDHGPSRSTDDLDDVLDLLDEVLDPVGDGRGSERYKRTVARVWTRRAIFQAADPAESGRAVA